jgi:EpsD family peptidyl-prolyl cis-trans isomerase
MPPRRNEENNVKRNLRYASALVCFTLAGCHMPHFGGNKPPTGQVVANVDGQEITVRELDAELAGVNLPNDPKVRKAAQQQALQRIIIRKLFAKAAREQGLDKTPQFVLDEARTKENLLAQALQAKLVDEMPAPTRDEATRYISDHPDLFSERKIFSVDQVRVARVTDPNLVKAIQPLNTLPDVEALLTKENIQFQAGAGSIDSIGSDPKLVEAIAKLPPGEVFVFPSGDGGMFIDQVRDSKVVPYTGEPAVTYALGLLKRTRVEEALQRQGQSIVAKAAGTIRYNPAYQPPKANLGAPAPGATTSSAKPAPAG